MHKYVMSFFNQTFHNFEHPLGTDTKINKQQVDVNELCCSE